VVHKLTEWPGEDDLVFPSTSGAPLGYPNMLRRVLRPAAAETGAPWAGFHTFRHTCASMLFERGANAVKVQRWLGHHSPAFTLATYVHLMDGQLGDPLELDVELARVLTEVQTDGHALNETEGESPGKIPPGTDSAVLSGSA